MDFERKYYLDKLIERKNNRQIKLITGVRRCGKSYLLNEIFYKYLLESGVKTDHIIKVDFNDLENDEILYIKNALAFLKSKIVDDDIYYFLLDEVQLMVDPDNIEDKTAFFKVLNSLMHVKNADIYASGSNSKLLSRDIESIFRGRCDSVRVHPLTFKEFFNASDLSKEEALDNYKIYGGLPHVYSFNTPDSKADYLKDTFNDIYKLDIEDRYEIRNNIEFEELVNFVASQIGSIVSYQSLSNSFKSIKKKVITDKTIKKYLDFMINAYVLSMSKRYNLKGKRYIDGKCKYYFEDLGLRNARLNFSQIEESHLMENLIYNELIQRGYNVDTGDVPIKEKKSNNENTFIRKNLEVDFVANKNGKKFYIQSALDISNEEKLKQEEKSLLNVDDAHEKLIIVKNIFIPRTTDQGIKIISIYDFLLGDAI